MAVYKRGMTYWFTFIFDGQRVQKSTRQKNRKAAVDIESAYRTRLAKGEVGLVPPKRERRTIGELLDALKTTYTQDSKLSAQNRSLIARAREDFGTTMATELASEAIDKYIKRRKEDGAANATINRVLEILRRAFKSAKVPLPEIDRLSEAGNARQGFFSESELDTLVSHLPQNVQDFARFAAACGMRKGEIAGLTWKMIEGDELRIPGDICKNGKDRIIPLTGELAEIIERRRQTMLHDQGDGTAEMCEHIFHRGGSPVAEIRKSWQSAALAAGLGIMVCRKCGGRGIEKRCPNCKIARKYEGKLFHDLRRTAVRNMVKAGVSTQVAKRWSGHKSDSMFERYSILTTDDMREAQKKTEEYRKSQLQKVVTIAR